MEQGFGLSCRTRATSKVAIIGAGLVGATCAYAMMIRGVASEIVLVDVNEARVKGEVMDLVHGLPFVRTAAISYGTYADCAGADVIIVTAGAAQRPGETRLDLVTKNLAIYKSMIPQLEAVAPEAILIIVTNPVDIMTFAAIKLSRYPKERVIGSGTVLDSARFRYLLSDHCKVDPKNVHAYILGEHGDSEVAAWSLANVAGVRLSNMCAMCGGKCSQETKDDIFEQVRRSAYHIIDAKGATYYAVGLALVEITEAIIRDEHSVLPVSVLLEGHLGLSDVALSVPAVVDRSGVSRLLDIELAPDEIDGLRYSAQVLRDVLDSVGM